VNLSAGLGKCELPRPRVTAAAVSVRGSAGGQLPGGLTFDWGGLHVVGAAMTRRAGPPCRMTARLPRRANRSRSPTGDGQPRDPQLASLMAARARAVMGERLIVMLITDLKA